MSKIIGKRSAWFQKRFNMSKAREIAPGCDQGKSVMYQLIMVRHAIAMDRDEAQAAGIDDEQRPLTDKGRQKMQKIAQGLVALLDRCAVIYSSPLLRAQQTAGVVAGHFSRAPVVPCPALSPGVEPGQLLHWLQARSGQTPAIVVGHEPDLSQWAGWALTGQAGGFVRFKKGGACMLEFSHKLEPGCARLRWLCTPKQLMAMGELQ